MQPIQVILQNLLYDISQISIPWDRMDDHFLAKPRNWSPKGILQFTICLGPISSIFDISTFLYMWFYFGVRDDSRSSLFQSAWFVEWLLTQTLIVHMIRTDRIPFFQSTAAPAVVACTLAIMCVGVSIPYLPFGSWLSMTPLPGMYFPYLLGALSCYFLLMQVAKRIYLHVFKDWL
jgi:Mg2+-importing ATPase